MPSWILVSKGFPIRTHARTHRYTPPSPLPTLDDDEYINEVKHETLVQRLYAGAGIELSTNKRRRCACWPRIATRNARQLTTFRSSTATSSIVGLALTDGRLHSVVCGEAPVPNETHRDGTPFVSFFYLFTVEEKEFFKVPTSRPRTPPLPSSSPCSPTPSLAAATAPGETPRLS